MPRSGFDSDRQQNTDIQASQARTEELVRQIRKEVQDAHTCSVAHNRESIDGQTLKADPVDPNVSTTAVEIQDHDDDATVFTTQDQMKALDRLEVLSEAAGAVYSSPTKPFAAPVKPTNKPSATSELEPLPNKDVGAWIDDSEAAGGDTSRHKQRSTAAQTALALPRLIASCLWVTAFSLYVALAACYTTFWLVAQACILFQHFTSHSAVLRRHLGSGLDWLLELWESIWA